MKRLEWMALAGVLLIVVGCSKPEPAKPAGGGKNQPATEGQKAAPAPAKGDDYNPPPSSEPAASKDSAPSSDKTETTAPPPGKVGTTSALGKALWKGWQGDAKPAAPAAPDDKP